MVNMKIWLIGLNFFPFSYVLRMKEYEREWRMNKRAERIAKKQAKMEAMD